MKAHNVSNLPSPLRQIKIIHDYMKVLPKYHQCSWSCHRQIYSMCIPLIKLFIKVFEKLVTIPVSYHHITPLESTDWTYVFCDLNFQNPYSWNRDTFSFDLWSWYSVIIQIIKLLSLSIKKLEASENSLIYLLLTPFSPHRCWPICSALLSAHPRATQT